MVQQINAIIQGWVSRRKLARTTVRAVHEALENRRLLSGYTLSALASFNGINGEHPHGGLIMGSAGNLYGTVPSGGADNGGAVFEIAKGSDSISILASFNGAFGEIPLGSLVMDSAGNLYGAAGGAEGSIFEITQGSGVMTTLATFDATDGLIPSGGLVIDTAGNLYGTTRNGGDLANHGTVFELAQGSDAITTLASFNGINGSHPQGGLVLDAAGNLYGATETGGGTDGEGTVFEVANGSGAITRLATFDGTNGGNPQGDLIIDAAGNLFGTAEVGAGMIGNGAVFEVARGSGIITDLATFNKINGEGPSGALAMDSFGNLYGTTAFGGADKFEEFGTTFEVAKGSNAITTAVDLDGANGASPFGGLVIDTSGDLYGTAAAGGANHDGAVFELTPNPAAQLAFAALPPVTGVGTVLVPPITVNVEDASENVVAGDGSTVTLAIASGPAGATLTGDVSVAAVNGVATFDNLSINRPGAYTFSATDGVLPVAASSSFLITSNAPASAIVPTLGHIVLPASVVAGAPLNAKIPVAITNSGSALRGIYTINLFIDTSTTLDSNQVLISTSSKNISLIAGRHTVLNFTLKPLSATLPAGTYFVLAQVIDPTGGTNVTASSQTIQVIAPFVSIAATVGPFVPSTLNIGQSGSVLVTVTNNGNVSATGLLDFTLSPSADGVSPLLGNTLGTLVVKEATIAPGKSKTFRLRFKPTALSAGTYFSYLSASLGGNATAFVGPQFMVA